MNSHFTNPTLRFSTALCLLLLAAAHPASGAVTFSGDAYNDGTSVFVGNTGQGSLNLTGGIVTATSGTVGSAAGSTGTVNVSGGNWTNSGTLIIGRIGTGSLTITGGTVSNTDGTVSAINGGNGTVNVSGGSWTNSGFLRVGNTISGTGSLTITNGTVSNTDGTVGRNAGSTGIVNVSGGNWTNSGNLTIASAGNGTLNLTGNGTVSVGSGLVSLADTSGRTGTLNLGNGTAAGTLSAARITGGNGTAVVNINQSGSYTLGSNMTGSLSLNHIGTGNTSLAGANTYTGNTTVSAGTLNVNGSTSASSSFTVASGATLGGNGTIGGATMIYGIHSPGNSPGIQTFTGNLTYDTSGGNGPTVNWQLSDNTDSDFSAFDQIVVGGNLAFNAATSLVLDFSGYGDVDWADPFWTSDQSWVIYDVTGTTTGANNFSIATANWADNSGDSFNTLLSASSFSLGLQGNDFVLNYTAGTSAVPEPSQVAASLLALVGLGIYLWRKKHAAQASRLRS
jgi:T5SS/PEP-CTERM-associated repeat protein